MIKHRAYRTMMILLIFSSWSTIIHAQLNTSTKSNSSKQKIQEASGKVEKGLKKGNRDTLAQGYYDLGLSFYQTGDLEKSEGYLKQSKKMYQQADDPEGIAKSSRALAQVQEDLHKDSEALGNYSTAKENSLKSGDINANALNSNDVNRLLKPVSPEAQRQFLNDNIFRGLKSGDTADLISNYQRMGDLNLKTNQNTGAVDAFNTAYILSKDIPEQAQRFNQRITDVYLGEKNFSKAIETKKGILNEQFVQNSTQLMAIEMASLADIYIQMKNDSTAMRLLNESYALSVKNGHTIEAKICIEKLDSIFHRAGRKELSLLLYKNFLTELPGIIAKDSSIADNRIIAETEFKIKELEVEKALKDDLIRRKNIFNYWLTGSLVVLALFSCIILYILKKLRTNNKKIALQSLRREMNPHFIFNSLNSINQFISNNNELEANRYLTKFSTLMRRVMENSKEDFVLFPKEIELLENYLELEKSRFSDKFDFDIGIDDALLVDEHVYIPGMLVQPHLENAVWHGLRYMDEKGFLQLRFVKSGDNIDIFIEDNGIGIAESKKHKTNNQKKHSGRGITNTFERIKILNELYRHHITCEVEDKQAPGRGVKVKITVPYLKKPS